MMNVDGLLSMNGEAQAMEAPFDGANGEAASSADVWAELALGFVVVRARAEQHNQRSRGSG